MNTGDHLGPYEILSPLGAGGMGEVYRAKDTRLGREVAIKVLPEEFAKDPDRLVRFEREAKAVAALSHPNILALYDVGTEGSIHYAVLELLEGETLRERLSAGAIPVRKAVEWAVHAAKGLAAAHDKGIVHRDLKPENLFLTKDGQIKILDFGLAGVTPRQAAKGADSPTVTRHTDPGTVMGTVGYMSPEQVRGKTADPRSDIFSLGAILYEIVSGHRAFQGESQADTLSAILKEDPPDLIADGNPTRSALDRIVRQCLEKQAADRFQSAHDLALAFEAAVSGSEPPTLTREVTPFVLPGWRKKQWTILATAAILLLAVFAAGFWVWKDQDSPPALLSKTKHIKVIAVFPLDDISADGAQSYFAPAMTEALTTKLTQIKSLKVIGQASAARCKTENLPLPKVAAMLGVDAVVQGSVVRAEDAVRISVVLLDARTDANLWAESYERKMADVLVLQGEVAQAIAGSVRAVVTPDEKEKLAGRPVDPRAYEEYLSGMHAWLYEPGKQSAISAIAHYKKAIEIDSGYAAPHAALSHVYIGMWQNSWLSYEEAYPLAKSAALKARELGPSETRAHLAVAAIKGSMEEDMRGYASEILRALELNDNDPTVLTSYSRVLLAEGRLEEAVQMQRKAVELDPLLPGYWAALSGRHAAANKWDEAIRSLKKSLELGYPDVAIGYSSIGYTYALKGDKETALAYASKAQSVSGWERDINNVANLAGLYAMTGMRAECSEMLRIREPLRRGFSGQEIDSAIVYAWLGERERAFEHLRKGASMPGATYYLVGLAYTFPIEFRRDPRYIAQMERLGLPLKAKK